MILRGPHPHQKEKEKKEKATNNIDTLVYRQEVSAFNIIVNIIPSQSLSQ